MKRISLLIKPSSSLCNAQCDYCFYNDEAEHRSNPSYGIMNKNVLTSIVKQAASMNLDEINLSFQGGEPTLVGLDFYKEVINLSTQFLSQTKVSYAIQTNGHLINDDWCVFLKKHNFLVGVSLDGPKHIHNVYRKSKSFDIFDSAMNSISLLKKYKIDFNILCVVTNTTCDNVNEVYRFYKQNNLNYLQFIPLITSLDINNNHLTLSKSKFTSFLSDLFILYYNGFTNNNYVSIRYFDNLLRIIIGLTPQSCDLFEGCRISLVIEGDGSIFPCDFYSLDSNKLGNILDDSLEDIFKSNSTTNFIKQSLNLPSDCYKCDYFSLCSGGCMRYRNSNINLSNYKHPYCDSYKSFFKKHLRKLEIMAQRMLESNR